MQRKNSAEYARLELIRLCHRGLDSRTLRLAVLKRLRAIIPVDVAFFATTDPATLLFTGGVIEDILEPARPQFIANEFLQHDFNKFVWLLRNNLSVGVLSEATEQEMQRSQRYRDILTPLGLGDELRAVLVTNAACWGMMCMHRERSRACFTPAEAAFLARLTPHFAEGLRKALLLEGARVAKTPEGPGVLVLTDDLSIVSMTPAAEYWLAELAAVDREDRHALPPTVTTVVTCLQSIERELPAPPDLMPKVRLRMPSGHWLVVYASRLWSSGGSEQISVIFEVAQPLEVAPLIMQAYELTKREGEITQLILRGLSTSEIAAVLQISSYTVQDHLKAIFEKVDVCSRRELGARIFAQQYEPRIEAGAPLDPSGSFTYGGVQKD
jgi:DNA-binding CsgD family transcriptional regulator